MCTVNSLKNYRSLFPRPFPVLTPLILSTSCNFTFQPPIPVLRHEPVYSNVDSSLGMHEQSNVQSKLMTNHVSKRSTGLKELKGLFLWLNTGNAMSFLSTDFSIISWKATSRSLVLLPGCKLALLSDATLVLRVRNLVGTANRRYKVIITVLQHQPEFSIIIIIGSSWHCSQLNRKTSILQLFVRRESNEFWYYNSYPSV